MKPAVKLELLALLHPVPGVDEAQVFHVFDRGIAGQNVPIVQVPEALGQVREGGVSVVSKKAR